MKAHTSWCDHAGEFYWCESCDRAGRYYFGDRILSERYLHNKARWKWQRAEWLEATLELIEDEYADGSAFGTQEIARKLHTTGHIIYPVLRWLEHIRLIHRTQSRHKNWWAVEVILGES